MVRQLDFSTLPGGDAFERRSVLIGLPEGLRARLSSMPQTLERVDSAVMFAAHCSGESWRAAAFLRAALVDYCSIEEMQGVDRPACAHFKLATSPNPLLHILALLRHLNVHVQSAEAAAHSINVQFKGQASDLDVYVISNLDPSNLAALKNGKHYNRADIDRAVAWFAAKQMMWGAGDLVRMGTELLAGAICDHYGL